MTTITLDDALISEVIAISHQQNPQEAVAKILVDYLQQHKNKPSLFNQLRLVGDSAGYDLAILFQRDQDTVRSLIEEGKLLHHLRHEFDPRLGAASSFPNLRVAQVCFEGLYT